MNADPLVSIVLPTYNGAAFLEKALESVRCQTYTNWELIVVDDASTDLTPHIIETYVRQDDRIRCIRHEENRRLPAALNSGFAQAHGVYLTWTSDDNCFRPQAISEMVNFMENRPDIDLVYTDFTKIDEYGNITESVVVRDKHELIRRNCVMASFLYRRSVYEKVGNYDEDLFLAEDYDYWLRASIFFELQPLHKDLYLYRCHSASLTTRRKEDVKIVRENVLAKNLPLMKWVDSRERSRVYLSLRNRARSHKDKQAYWKYSFRAMYHSPVLFIYSVLLSVSKTFQHG